MNTNKVTESVVEQAALACLEAAGWQILDGAGIAPGEPGAERESYKEVILERRLREALVRLNPELPHEVLEDAVRQLGRPEGTELIRQNHSLHRSLVDGVNMEYRTDQGDIRGVQVRVLDYTMPEANDWLAVNQFSVTESRRTRRPDIVLFINGIPVGVIELKNATTENATVWDAFQQLQTYQAEIPSLFVSNALLVVSDGLKARVGVVGAGREWFKPWRTITGKSLVDKHTPEIQAVTKGLCNKQYLLHLIRDFFVFEDHGDRMVKKMAGYHQFHAVQAAVDETRRAAELVRKAACEARQGGGEYGDRRIGVVWHTQGAGKSLTMAFYAGRIIRDQGMKNPTVVVLTDRNDLDDQLFGTFSRCVDLLRQPPVQANTRKHLRELLEIASGGVVFTTIHKFFPDQKGDRHPVLSRRSNLVVIADEAHRSQYDFMDGFARHLHDALPHASFIGFTGTPIEKEDANTRAVFGDYISIYDIQRSVEDGATVPIYYESRLAKLSLDEAERPNIDPDFEEATEGEEVEQRERLKSRWAQLEAIAGTDKRLAQVASDIVDHFKARLEAPELMGGKGMIVCMSRRIAVELYGKIRDLRPGWHDDQDDRGEMKLVMTGSASDPPDWQPHIRDKARREALANRFRDPKDCFRLVIVRDMWLTGFDAPSLHTMYIDKPMRGHNLMQAIARVNRVFREKPGGLVVDYLGLTPELKQALATYTESGGEGQTAIAQQQAVDLMLEKYEICCSLFHGFDWSSWVSGSPEEKMRLLLAAQEHILAQEDGKNRLLALVRDLSRAFALSVPHEEALRIRDDVAFFQAVKVVLSKKAPGEARQEDEIDQAVEQIIARAVAPDGVVDIFATAGLAKPDISILSDEFLAEVRNMPQRNLAVELLQKLLNGEIQTRRKKNLVQARSFAEMLEQALRRYQNRAIEATQVIEELIALAHEMREADARGEKLGLNEDEVAFYDALGTNDSAVQVLGDEKLQGIARELVQTVKKNVTIDWTLRENIQANLRVLIKRILRRHGYPPDKREKATRTVLEQANLFSAEWAG